MVWCGVVWCGVVWCGVVWCGVVWCGVVWCGVVWCGVVWCGVCGVPVNLHTEVFWTDTRGRGERGEGSHRQFCLPRKAHEEFSLGPTNSPKETLGSYPFKV